MAIPDTKPCSVCKQILGRDQFTPDRRSPAGLQPQCKKCRAAIVKANRYKDHDASKAAARAYYAKNNHRFRQREAKYREADREKIRQRAKVYYAANRDKCMAWHREDRKRHPERTRELARGWQATRRAKKTGGITAPQLREWFLAQKKICHWCGVKCQQDSHIDHIIPLAKGGGHEARNLCIACPPCNLRKGARDPIEWAQMIGKLL